MVEPGSGTPGVKFAPSCVKKNTCRKQLKGVEIAFVHKLGGLIPLWRGEGTGRGFGHSGGSTIPAGSISHLGGSADLGLELLVTSETHLSDSPLLSRFSNGATKRGPKCSNT